MATSDNLLPRFIITASSIVALAAALAGCHAKHEQALLETVDSPAAAQNRPLDYQSLSMELEQARTKNVNLVAPKYFNLAEHDVRKAEEVNAAAATNSSKRVELGRHLASARKNLDLANQSYEKHKLQMQPVIEARATALEMGGAKSPKFTVLEKRFVTIGENLDSNYSEKYVGLIPELASDYRNITYSTVENDFLGEARANVELAKREGAKNLVPKTLAETERTVKNAEDYIKKDPQSKDMISQLSQQAAFESRRTLALTRQIKSWKGLSNEELALREEGLISMIGTSLQESDLRDQNFEAHATKLSETASSLRQEHDRLAAQSQDLQSNLVKAQSTAAALGSKTQELEASKKLEDEYQQVRSIFSEKEAVVNRQNDKIVVSFRNIKFKTGDSKIPTESFTTLEKMNKAIQAFNSPQVIIEGHTDSTGTASLNKALSEERAKAVKEYLASVNVVPESKIEVVGYGSEKPLASNESKEGRAVNRRIDLVIIPQN